MSFGVLSFGIIFGFVSFGYLINYEFIYLENGSNNSIYIVVVMNKWDYVVEC